MLGVPNVSAATVTVSLATPPTSNNCPAGAVAAAIASVGPGGIPTPISPTATTVCIE
ncbi:MAG TPA: hypothetical protein VE223_04540 [Nitrososphaeraceae archaeon]|nr:hypothetical protein [Nitrososphaeraceae archaeon]